MFVTGIKMEYANHLSGVVRRRPELGEYLTLDEYPPNVRYMVPLPAKDHAGSCYPRYCGYAVKEWQL